MCCGQWVRRAGGLKSIAGFAREKEREVYQNTTEIVTVGIENHNHSVVTSPGMMVTTRI